MKLSDLYWHRITPLHILLWPLSLLFIVFMRIRKLCYWLDFFSSVRLPVPVIVIDSITIEDGGKTPLAIWLVEKLIACGFCPGVIAEGNLDNPSKPEAVTLLSDPTTAGGKALLMANRFEKNCPVWIGGNPANVARALLKEHPDCNVIICTYGLRYPRLERDFEIAVADFNEPSYGNGLLLPAGPLRVSLKRLNSVDAVVVNCSRKLRFDTSNWAPTYHMKLIGDTVYNKSNPAACQLTSSLKDKQLHAVATYDNAQWFTDFLQQLGLQGKLQTVAEDHRFIEQDFSAVQADTILMLEENALQCYDISNNKIWALSIEAWVNGEMQAQVIKKLRERFADSEVLNEMICPHCKSQLHHLENENILICKQDQLAFPIKNGIPNLQLQSRNKLAA